MFERIHHGGAWTSRSNLCRRCVRLKLNVSIKKSLLLKFFRTLVTSTATQVIQLIIFTIVKLINILHNLQMCGGVSSEIQDLIVNGSWCRVVMVTRNSDGTISQTIVFNICSDNNLQPGDNTQLHFTILNIKWIEYKIETKSQFSRWWRVDVIFSIPPPCWWYAWYQFQDNSKAKN